MKPPHLSRIVAAALAGVLAVPVTAAPPADDTARIVHVLNRLGWGPRPGDVEKVRAIGLERWIEQQTAPATVPDPAVEARLAQLTTVALPSSTLLARYELPREAKQELQKKRAEMGEDASEDAKRRARRDVQQEMRERYGDQMDGTPRQVLTELQSAKLIRAVYSERQLDEVLVDFWSNHFNVFANKGPEKFLIGAFERDVVRPHAWGKFEDLLLATAKSPAMLFYLDNWLSVDAKASENAMARAGQRRRRPGRPNANANANNNNRRRGLNENYAREIMELHTLGVDGGYTQKDVTEVARCLTGWTIDGLRRNDPVFRFTPAFHDRGDKVVLGQVIRGGGQDEGEQVIHMLATHPATARFIATKLARRLVSDEPPAALVDHAAQVFRTTGGDIRAVVRAIVTAPEFLAPETRAAKIKTPFDFVVSALRASGAEVVDARDAVRRIGAMGMPLYQQQPPTGYKDTAEAWVSTSGLLARLNFALDLAAGRVRGVQVPAGRFTAADGTALAASLVPGGLTDSTRETLAKEKDATGPRLAGLILGSPEFQRR